MRSAQPLSHSCLLAFLVCAAPAAAQVLAPNLIYTSVQPCRVFDTRSATNGTNGRLIHGVAQTFNVVGGNVTSTYFTGQGGHNGGCSLPGFDPSVNPQVQAVVLNFVAVGSAGAGDIVAWPSDQAQPSSSIINYANSASLGFLNIANGSVVPVRQDSQGADITLKAQVSDTDVLADVVGYFSSVSAVQGSGGANLFLGTSAGNPGASTAKANTAIGLFALSSDTTGHPNTAVGFGALSSNTTGASNTAVGYAALFANTTGSDNVALGPVALELLLTGSNNIAVGHSAGYNYASSESNNITIGNTGTVGESNVIRIGTAGSGPGQQSATFIAGINGATSSGGTAVFVNTAGQLGTATSSLRFKEDVTDMGEASEGLMRLRPVSFRYKAAHDDGSRLLQYGLIAEEVAAVDPDLVQYDQEGQPQAVRYHFVNAMLLNEVQKQHRTMEELSRLAAAQQARIEALEARLATLEAKQANRH
jgi:hypothetical protein